MSMTMTASMTVQVAPAMIVADVLRNVQATWGVQTGEMALGVGAVIMRTVARR